MIHNARVHLLGSVNGMHGITGVRARLLGRSNGIHKLMRVVQMQCQSCKFTT